MSKGTIKYLAYKMLSLDSYLKFIYKWYHKKSLNLNDPKDYTEKLFWLKKYNGKKPQVELIRKVYDKYRVKEHIKNKGYEEYLPKLYQVCDNADEIKFDMLPSKYVIKISQSNGYNFINNGFEIKEDEVRSKVQNWLDLSNDLKSMEKKFKEEKYYFDGKSKIICEEYISKCDGKPANEYCVFCFNGEPKFISIELDSINEDGSIKNVYWRNTFDFDWNFIPVNMGRDYNESIKVDKIKNLEKIYEISKSLSEDFIFCRVDFFDTEDRLYIGEVTFIPQGASRRITPDKYENIFGSWINLPTNEEINEKN